MKLSDFRRVCVGNRKILLQMKFCVGAAAATIALRSPVTGSLPSSCARAVGHRMTTDLAARYLYRRSHSARNSRSSGDHGGSTSLKLILTQPKSALVKQYQRLFEMESIACPSVSIVCNPPGHACAPLCLGMRAAPLKMLCGIPAARGRRARRDDGRNCIGVAPWNRLVPGGRAPHPIWPFGWACAPHPHPTHRPRPSAKGRGLPFRGHRYADRSNLRTSRYASINVARSWRQRPVLKAEPITRYSWATVSATREPRRGYFTTGSELPQSVTGAVQRGFTRGKRAYMLRGERNRRSIRRKRTRL